MRRVREEIARVVATGEARSLELAIHFDDGGIAHHYSTINAGRDDRGVVVRILGTTLDITARKETERSVSSLMNAVEHTDEVVFMTEVDGAITYVNPAFERVYGYTKAESLGRTPRLIKSGTMAPEYFRRLWTDLLAGKSSRARHVNRDKGGNLVIADTSINPIMGSTGDITGFICVQNDITERERIEQEKHDLEIQLFQSQKMESLGTLAGGIAHDFNNILGIIMGYASMLEGTRPDPSVLQKHLDAILGATQRGANLVRQILTFARKSNVEFQHVDISGVIREVVVMLSETFPRTIAFTTQMEEGPLVVKADRTLIHQALLNLCVNARDAMPNGGQLTIRTSTIDGKEVRSRFRGADAERYLLLSLRDTGIGMSRATIGRIFEPFFTTKEPGKGTGLGLSVVYGIVNSHNGFVDVESTPGTGTAVSLYLPFPRAAASKESAVRRGDGESRGGSETILVVEDEPMLQELLRDQLEARGYSVLTANDGEEAVRVFAGRANDIDLVLTDLGLPRMSGWDAFKEMQKIIPGIRCVVATGYLEPAAKNDMLASGAKEFVHKPYLPQDVIGKVRQVLDEDAGGPRR
jgi:PAS domain S-box-containing protein